MIFLVVNNNKGSRFLSYEEKYKVFTNGVDAKEHALELGWEDPMGMGITSKIGHASMYKCGDVDVEIVCLQES